ncbi:MAG: DUF2185 domain-containing protein [Bdellovibrionota bacterium]
MEKNFKLSQEEIEDIATGHGACIATDKITVDGFPVRFMYREEGEQPGDSGWRFLSGLENDDYMNVVENHGVYDVNTIANYDPTIIPYLDSPVGSVFEKTGDDEEFAVVTDWSPNTEE